MIVADFRKKIKNNALLCNVILFIEGKKNIDPI